MEWGFGSCCLCVGLPLKDRGWLEVLLLAADMVKRVGSFCWEYVALFMT